MMFTLFAVNFTKIVKIRSLEAFGSFFVLFLTSQTYIIKMNGLPINFQGSHVYFATLSLSYECWSPMEGQDQYHKLIIFIRFM